MKKDFIRSTEGDHRMIDGNMKVTGALYVPVFPDDPTLNDNQNESGAIGAKAGQLWLYFDGVWLPVGGSGASFPDATDVLKGKIMLAGDLAGTADAPTVPALADKEDKSQKNVAGGYAGLNGSGVLHSAQLPSFVDDIIEVDDFASLPAIGESGKAYFTLDNGKTFRWGGSVYVEIIGSPGSTDAVPEGGLNLYFTNARAIASILTGYVKAAAATAITAGTSILEAIGILEKKIDDAITTLESKSDLDLTINNYTASHILVLADRGCLVEMEVASANTLTIPPNSDVAFPIGTQILISQCGAGQTSIVAGSGVTIQSRGGNLKLTGQHSAASLIKKSADVWKLAGDITT